MSLSQLIISATIFINGQASLLLLILGLVIWTNLSNESLVPKSSCAICGMIPQILQLVEVCYFC